MAGFVSSHQILIILFILFKAVRGERR